MKLSKIHALTMLCGLFLWGCTTSPEDQLKSELKKYTACMENNNIACLVNFMEPDQVKALGGRDSVIEVMKATAKEAPVNISKVKVDSIGKIQGNSESLSAVIETTVEMVWGEDELSSKQSIQAASYDNGEHWFFSAQ